MRQRLRYEAMEEKLNAEEMHIIFLPNNKTIKVSVGTNLLEAANKAGIIIPSLCARRGKCGKCKVKIHQAAIPFTQLEEITLSPEERSDGIHLACQINIANSLSVEILYEEKATTTQFLTYDLADKIKVDSHLKKIYVELVKPSVENQIDDSANLITHEILSQKQLLIPLPILQRLPTFLRKNAFKATIAASANQFISIEAGNTTDRLFGVAVDLGTTTIVSSLVDMTSGKIFGISAITNPQTKHGEDVISRIKYATSEPGGLVKLQTAAIKAINSMIEELCEKAKVKFREIYELSVAGNTIMNHLLLGVSPQFIAESPYIPAYRHSQHFMAEELGITIQPRGIVSTLPNISGYVGGDITGFILACDLHKSDKIILGIDIGTNGEIVLGSKRRLLCCSAAAGPAFEGGHISNGMRAMEGAIDKYSIEKDQVFFHVIGESEPKGICGTGLVDVVAELLRVGILDSTGKIVVPQHEDFPAWLRQRIIEAENNYSFALLPFNEANEEIPMLMTQQDIRELQLGKGAIAAGISILSKELGIEISDIDEVLIAGAFGSYLNKFNAQKIGLIPNLPSERVKFVGNTASLGAKKFLLSKKLREEAEEIINFAEYIELSTRLDFQDIFAEQMFFNAV